MSELLVIAKLSCMVGAEDAVLAAVPMLAQASRSERGVLSFDVYRSLDDPREVVLVERYSSRAGFLEHLAAPHYHDIAINVIIPKLESRTIDEYEVSATPLD